MQENALRGELIALRMHGTYLSRPCGDIARLSHALLGMHCWFHRNVCFSAIIRGAPLFGWKTALIKTWLYRGTLHGAEYNDLPRLLALHSGESYLERHMEKAQLDRLADEVVRYMEDGVFSRAEFRKIFAAMYEPDMIERLFSPWGGIFVHLAGQGRVAFRDMTSRDFDFISAEPAQSAEEVLPELLYRYFETYGPATVKDAAWFFGFFGETKRIAAALPEGLSVLEADGGTYFYVEQPDTGDIPELTLLSGFDPFIVSYADRSAVLPEEFRTRVILKSGICLPTIALNGRVAGLWNIKKNEPEVEFFTKAPAKTKRLALELVDSVRAQMRTYA